MWTALVRRVWGPGASRRVFFTSVPKSGKNVLYSFFEHLGYARGDARVEAACPGLLARACRHAGLTRHPRLDPRGREQQAAGRADWRAFTGHLRGLPEPAVLGQHVPHAAPLARGLARSGARLVFLYRNPRDVLTSLANYVRVQGKPRDLAARLGGLPAEEVLVRLLSGDGPHLPFATWLLGFHGWLSAPGVLALRFEDVIGPRGRGDAARQREALGRLAAHAGFAGPAGQLDRAVDRAFNPGAGTFFKGQIGLWRDHFTPRVEEAFARLAPGVLARFGYPEPAPAAAA